MQLLPEYPEQMTLKKVVLVITLDHGSFFSMCIESGGEFSDQVIKEGYYNNTSVVLLNRCVFRM